MGQTKRLTGDGPLHGDGSPVAMSERHALRLAGRASKQFKSL